MISMKKNITYTFKLIETCNMCGASTKNQKILGRRLSQSQGFSPSKKLGIATTVCQCASCGLIFANPLPMPANIQDHYGVPPENYWKPEYFRIDGNYFRTEIETFKKLKKFTSGMRSLDIGAGLGKQMLALERAGFDSYGF